MYDENGDLIRPATFGDCLDEGYGEPLYPCPWLQCRHHMAVYDDREGRLQIEPIAVDGKGGVNLLEMAQTCSLRAADRVSSHDEIAKSLGITREACRQLAIRGMDKIREEFESDDFDPDPLAPLPLPADAFGRRYGDDEGIE